MKRKTGHSKKRASSRPSGNVWEFGKDLYPADAILQTCTLFSDRARFRVTENEAATLVSISPPKGSTSNHLSDLKSDFQTELYHQVLRFRLAAENKKVREAIIDQALYAALPKGQADQPPPGPPDSQQPQQQAEPPRVMEEIREEDIDRELEEILKEVEAEDFKEDPLGIAIPWEEKHPKKKEDKQEDKKEDKGEC